MLGRVAPYLAVLSSAHNCCFAWTASGMSNSELVSNLKREGVVETDAVAKVLTQLDRGVFAKSLAAPKTRRSAADAYRDAPLPIADGATISAPHMHARALELLLPVLVGRREARSLDVGSGSGYLTAALALLSGGEAYGVEPGRAMIDFATNNVADAVELDPSLSNALKNRVHFVQADGWAGLPEAAPFDAIHVGAAAAQIPEALLRQLAPGGRMIIPIGPVRAAQQLVQIDKLQDGTVQVHRLFGVRYVELVKDGAPSW